MIKRCHIAIVVVLSMLSNTGCALFAPGKSDLLSQTQSLKPSQLAEFEDGTPVRRIVRLDTSIVSALSTDRRLRELAWGELDECGLMSPEDRRRLNQSGIRVGVSGGILPWALSSLLQGERVQQSQQLNSAHGMTASPASSSFGSHLAIPEGSSSIIELPNTDGTLIIPAGRIAGLHNVGELENAHCVLQMTAIEYGDGWVVIRFLPQIHHGAMTTRYSVSDKGERMSNRQGIHPLFEQQFELKLHTDETVVIGHQAQDSWTIGRLLFQQDTLSSRSERLIVLKLQDIEEVKGRKSLTVNYRKY